MYKKHLRTLGQRLVHYAVIPLIVLTPPPVLASDMVGSMIGEVSGAITTATGQQQIDSGAVSGDVSVSTDAAGNVTATVVGTVSCLQPDGTNVHINYTTSYNNTTGELTGTYADPGNGSQRPIQFTHGGGLLWQGNVSDSVAVNGQSYPYNIAIDLELPTTALYPGQQFPTGKRFSGPMTTDLTLTIPINLPQYQISETVTTVLQIDGQWQASAVLKSDGTTALTGSTEGTFLSQPITLTPMVQTPMGTLPYPISFSLRGTFGGSLFSRDLHNMQFAGTYAQTSSPTADESAVTYSGGLTIEVPLNSDGSISELPFTFNGTPSVSVLGTSLSIPITVSGRIPFVIE